MSVIPLHGRLRQEDFHAFEAHLGYLVSSIAGRRRRCLRLCSLPHRGLEDGRCQQPMWGGPDSKKGVLGFPRSSDVGPLDTEAQP